MKFTLIYVPNVLDIMTNRSVNCFVQSIVFRMIPIMSKVMTHSWKNIKH